MRKLLSVFLTLVLVLSAVPALSEDSGIGSDQALLDAILEYRAEGSTEFELILTREYYDSIRGYGSFDRFQVQMMLAGANDFSFKYDYVNPRLLAADVRWGEPDTVLCMTEEEVAAGIDRLLAQNLDTIRIVIDDETVNQKVYDENLLYTYAARNGVMNMRMQYTLRTPYIYTLSQIERSAIPYTVVTDTEEYARALEQMAKRNTPEFRIVATPDLYRQLQANDAQLISRLEALSPMDNWDQAPNRYYRVFSYSNVTYSATPRFFCGTESDFVEAIRQAGASGFGNFRLVLSKVLFDTLYANYRFTDRLSELHAEAGLTDFDLKYSRSTYALDYENAQIHADVVKLSTPQEANAYVADCVAKNQDNIVLFCSPELYTTLIGNINAYINIRVGMSPIFDTAAQAGIFNFELFFSEPSHIIELRSCEYYPGTKIVNAVRNGDTAGLTRREAQTLEAAQAMAERCAAIDPLETARAIHDELCAINVYTDDDSTEEDDTAIGALLNGEANCDGYADAFYLAGTLAGLNVRYQHGDSHDTWGSMLSDITHMWNLLEINGTWRLVDVTWDDRESGVAYTWFNLGEDRARRMHIWNDATGTALLPKTDLSVRPANEYLVSSVKKAKAAAKEAVQNGYASFSLIYKAPEQADRSETISAVREAVPGSFTYSWNEYMLMLTVNLITVTSQPSRTTVTAGETARFTVAASGDGLTYQWYYQKPGEKTWNPCKNNAASPTYSVAAESRHNGYSYRCRITNGDGLSMDTNAARLTVMGKPAITAQPRSKTVTAGDTATFKVVASGEGLSYQWYYLKPGTAAWVACKKNGTSDTYSVSAEARHNGYQYKCTVTNAAGAVTSKAVKLTVK